MEGVQTMLYLTPDDEARIVAGAYECDGAAAILVNDKGEVLLLQRDDKPDIIYPNLWNFPGGGVEAGESLMEAALREVFEETGFAAPTLEPFAETINPVKKGGLVERVALFRGHIECGLDDLTLGEGQDMQFFDRQGWLSLDLIPFQKDALKLLFATVRR